MWSIALASAFWQYFVPLPSSSQVFSAFAKQFFSDTSILNLTYSICVTTRAKSLSFACIYSLMVLKVLGQLVTSFPGAITQTAGRFRKKDSVTGLGVTLQSSSRIFQVTGLTFSPRKCNSHFHHENANLLFVFLFVLIR